VSAFNREGFLVSEFLDLEIVYGSLTLVVLIDLKSHFNKAVAYFLTKKTR
jgi:hypothetical protein